MLYCIYCMILYWLVQQVGVSNGNMPPAALPLAVGRRTIVGFGSEVESEELARENRG